MRKIKKLKYKEGDTTFIIMVTCKWYEREITVRTVPPAPSANVEYGTDLVPQKKINTGTDGAAHFCWTKGINVYVRLQKTDFIFSDSPTKPSSVGWGATSKWFKISALSPSTKVIYSFIKPPVPELPPEPKPLPEPKLPPVEEVCRAWQTSAEPRVPSTLSTYFPISIHNARWICEDTGVPENITGTGIIRIEGYEFDIPIRNGYGPSVNLGDISRFKDIYAGLVR